MKVGARWGSGKYLCQKNVFLLIFLDREHREDAFLDREVADRPGFYSQMSKAAHMHQRHPL